MWRLGPTRRSCAMGIRLRSAGARRDRKDRKVILALRGQLGRKVILALRGRLGRKVTPVRQGHPVLASAGGKSSK